MSAVCSGADPDGNWLLHSGPPPIIVWGDWLCCGTTFQLLVWERMHLWGNRGFGLCVMTSSVSVWVVHDDG